MDNPLNPPLIDHDRSYTKGERLQIAPSHYYQKLQEYTKNTATPKPIILQFTRTYNISETTLRESSISNTPSSDTV